MKSRKGTGESTRIEHAVGRAVNYEVNVADLARRSEKRAWRVAGAAVALSLILAGGYFYMLPLKEKVPYIVMADPYSGTATAARLTGSFGDMTVSTREAIDRSNVAHYVRAREAYDLALMNIRDWATVYTMSTPEVATGYTTLNASTNPESPFKIYGRDKAIRVQINSIQMLGGSPTTPPKGATVRFQRTLYEKTTGYTQFLDNRIASLEFKYDKNLKMDEKHRIENPLGFRVTSYRVDIDYSSTPPPATPAPATLAPTPDGANMLPSAMQVPAQPVPGAPADAAQTVPGAPGAVPAQAVPGVPGAAPANVPPATAVPGAVAPASTPPAMSPQGGASR